MISKSLQARIAKLEETLSTKEPERPHLFTTKFIRLGSDGAVEYEMPENKLTPLRAGEKRKVCYLHAADLPLFHRELLAEIDRRSYAH